MARVVETGYSCGPKEYRYTVRLKEHEQAALASQCARTRDRYVSDILQRIVDRAIETAKGVATDGEDEV